MNPLSEALGLGCRPVAVYRSPSVPEDALVPEGKCVIPLLLTGCARNGGKYAADAGSIRCHGAVGGLGFGGIPDRGKTAVNMSDRPPEEGRPGKRYFRDPECAMRQMECVPDMGDGEDAIVFQDLDSAEAEGIPVEVVVFLVNPVELSALMQLAAFSRTSEGPASTAPFGLACQQIYAIPMGEAGSDDPRGVIGMTDMYARRFVPPDILSYAVPYSLYRRMVSDIGASFFSQQRYLDNLSAASEGKW